MRVFLDTNIISTATDEKVGQHPEVHAGKHSGKGKPDRDITLVMQSMVRRLSKEPNSGELKQLREVSEAAGASSATFCYSHEVQLELLFQERVTEFFYGAGVDLELVGSPAEYRDPTWPERFEAEESGVAYMSPGPVLKGFVGALQTHPERAADLVAQFLLRLPDDSSLLRHEFRVFHSAARATNDEVPKNAASLLRPCFERLQDARYVELVQMLEVQQLSERKKANGYVDAFLLWTAETADCTHFLTIDSGVVARHKHDTLRAVLPSEILPMLRSATP